MANGYSPYSWHYRNARVSGDAFENSVSEIVKRFTHLVWKNVRMETLLTQTGSTELDLVCYFCGVAYILELKRVRKITGDYSQGSWRMCGWLSGDDANDYSVPNVIEQNNIHARSLMDLYYSEFKAFPQVVPLIVVPDGCEFPKALRSEVYTVRDLERFFMSCVGENVKEVAFRLSFLLASAGEDTIRRKDFVDLGWSDSVVLRGRGGYHEI